MAEGVGGGRRSPLYEFESNLYSAPVAVNGQTIRSQPARPSIVDGARSIAELARDAAESIVDRQGRIADTELRIREAEAEERLADMQERSQERREARRGPPPPDPNTLLITQVLMPLLEKQQAPPVVQPLTADDVARIIDDRTRQTAQAPDPFAWMRSAFEMMQLVQSNQPQPPPTAVESPVLLQMRHDQIVELRKMDENREDRDTERAMDRERQRQEAEGQQQMQNRLDLVLTDVIPRMLQMFDAAGKAGTAQPETRAPFIQGEVIPPDMAVFSCTACQHDVYAQPSLGAQIVACPNCRQQFQWTPTDN